LQCCAAGKVTVGLPSQTVCGLSIYNASLMASKSAMSSLASELETVGE